MLAQQSLDGRKTDRVRCRIRGTIRFMLQKLDIIVLDISRTGMALQLQAQNPAASSRSRRGNSA